MSKCYNFVAVGLEDIDYQEEREKSCGKYNRRAWEGQLFFVKLERFPFALKKLRLLESSTVCLRRKSGPKDGGGEE